MSNEYHMLINGCLVGSDTNESYGVINPSTGQQFARAPHASESQAAAAISAASEAYRTWRSVPMADRRAAIRKVDEILQAHADELAELLVREQGKPLAAARGEVAGCSFLLQKAAAIANDPEVYSETEERRVEVRRVPIGVVACITPWNFPLFCSVQKWAPAIVLGNTVVHKPSPFTPLTSLRLAELMSERDCLPPGVYNCLSGDDGASFNVGAFLTGHPQVAKVSFTGSVATGKSIMRKCAGDVKRITLELGGNDAAIIRSDVDVQDVAPKVFAGAFGNSGQVCCAIKRCFVHESIYKEFKEELVKCASGAKFGDGMAEGTEYGPLNNQMQFDKVSEYVEDARAQGCDVLCGGRAKEGAAGGYFYEPTIVGNIKEGIRLWDEEQFGPVLPIAPYSDDAEAMRRANASDLGLGGSVWSSDASAAADLAAGLEAGTVWVNQHTDLTGAPFGGFKQSGLGRELGKADVTAFTESQTLSLAK